MTRADARRWTVLRRVQLRGQQRRLDYESQVLQETLSKAIRSSGAYRDQHAADLRSRLNSILRERHAVAAQIDTCDRELSQLGKCRTLGVRPLVNVSVE